VEILSQAFDLGHQDRDEPWRAGPFVTEYVSQP
jgi:hypothetical protein